jgi:hypothetical protein
VKLTPKQREILALANERGKFGVQIGYVESEEWQEALEELQESGVIRLIDVSPAAAAPRAVLRIFIIDKAKLKRMRDA